MRRVVQALAFGLVLACAGGALTAANDLKVGINQSRRILLRGHAANVVVGDPAIADVTMVDSHSVIVMGRGYGTTDLLVLDGGGRTLLSSRVSVDAPEFGRLTLHRGPAAEEFACSPRCEAVSGQPPQAAAAAPAPSPSSAPPEPQGVAATVAKALN